MASTCLGNCVFWEDHVTQNNLELMRTLDDSWNAQDWDTFEAAFQGHHRLLARSGRANERTRQSQGGVDQIFQDVPRQSSD